MSAISADLRGWGFLPGADIALAVNPEPAMREVTRKFATGRWVGRDELEIYAASLDANPTADDVEAHFECTRSSAYRYRARVLAIISELALYARSLRDAPSEAEVCARFGCSQAVAVCYRKRVVQIMTARKQP